MAFVAAPVAAWVGGAAASVGIGAVTAAGVLTGAAATIGALAGAVAVGVVTGAVIGAATALISGGDILEGALKGGLLGGATAGVVSGLGMATGLYSSTQQLASMGLNPTGTKLGSGLPSNSSSLASPVKTTNINSSNLGDAIHQGSGIDAQNLINRANDAATATNTVSLPSVAQKPSGGMLSKLFTNSEGQLSDSAGKIIAGGVEGMAQALATPEPPTPESQSEYLANVQRMNVPGNFQARVANIKIPDYWKKYTNNVTKNLSPITAPVNTGAMYA